MEGREHRASPDLLAEVRRYGEFDAQGCFSCGSCTLSCDLPSGLASFPRRPMRYTQLGLREELLGSVEPWLCHDCGDCVKICPRQADPNRAMMTLRRFLAAQYDWTGITAKVYQSRAWEIGAMVAVGAAVSLFGYLIHRPAAIEWLQNFTSGDLLATHPCLPLVKAFDWLLVGVIAIFLLSNCLRMHHFTLGRSGLRIPAGTYLTELRTLILHFGTQIGFASCRGPKRRWISHICLASGSVIMFVLVVLFLDWFQTDRILPLYHPQRWLGYLATGALLFATSDILVRYFRKNGREELPPALSDWLLPLMLMLTTLSGILIHILRYAGLTEWSWDLYAAHMIIAVPMLLVQIPFGNMSHMLYRPLAIYFQAVKERALAQAEAQPVPQAVQVS